MYAAIFVSGNQATVYTAPTEMEILQALRNWYAQNLEDEERHHKPAPEVATVAEISQDYAGGCSGYFIQVQPLIPIQALTSVEQSIYPTCNGTGVMSHQGELN